MDQMDRIERGPMKIGQMHKIARCKTVKTEWISQVAGATSASLSNYCLLHRSSLKRSSSVKQLVQMGSVRNDGAAQMAARFSV